MELVVLSGKGGTGKTTIATALSELEQNVVRIDCDVDAPNFYLFYKGKDIEKEDFFGGKKAVIQRSLCMECNKCVAVCRFDAISDFKVNDFDCEGCGACTLVCSQKAIELKDEKVADAYVTEIQKGIIVRAQMEIGSDGSGKLITTLRKNSKKYNDEGQKLIIADGSPGIGCPVISSITGSDAVLIVTEPTKSGLEDLKRVIALCQHFGVFIMICINKYDINEEMSHSIEDYIKKASLNLVGKIPYDDTVMTSINELKPITYYKESIANQVIISMWTQIKKMISEYQK